MRLIGVGLIDKSTCHRTLSYGHNYYSR